MSARSPTFRCLDCHREIATEIAGHHGLHATFPNGGGAGSACVKCHSDHNGVDFALIHWNPTATTFDHSKTGFHLEGKHVGVACRSCHTAKNIPANARALLHSKDQNHTWLGLSTSCSVCHEDKHQGRFGSNCTQCHSTQSWAGASIDAHTFDHSRTRFRLTGMHLQTSCQRCHTPGPDGQPRYSGLKFAACADCHADPHKGEFKKDCASCHTTVSWKKSSFTSTFDHTKTSFPLLGKHKNVSCTDCHRNGDFKAPVPHAQCADCHKPDPHNGQFESRPDGGRCESCHTVQGWSPSTFTIADHARTGFPLTPPHSAVKCAACHTLAGAQTRFKIKFALCADCHKDEHRGQFAGAPWMNHCERCHTGSTFKESNYTIAKHQKSSFPLSGSHIAISCNQCHKPIAGQPMAAFHFAHLSCTTCHEDVHHGQFATRMATLNAAGKPMGCMACHTTEDWQDLSRFDHSTTHFPLVGSHRAVACSDCHHPPNMEKTMLHVDFAGAPLRCNQCHEDPHDGQFGARNSDCASCHNTNKWRPSLFDHEKTNFPLKGGHQNVPCASCHTNKRLVDGTPVLFYKPTPTACADCHGSGVPPPNAHNVSKKEETLMFFRDKAVT